MKKYLFQRIVGELVCMLLQMLLFEFIDYIKAKLNEKKRRDID